ncbi:hypothetical protein [Effusibacillus lacus]|uniref:Uncharacterized protein n=1 Tax=Effusibacillus lacus TaxID=1348429 RepID=A0A292YKE0_9BACL|nr:hypothetical protein [Effusibacillus lacus]TCS72852.1 hypothetical protein EDD64_12067 [Effusibacillus lacus]GAX89223.1 hypothetical protein EFBL_0841 [Effusibacillus lacus]
MEITKAMEIIEKLADGIDPYTGEVFASDSPYQKAETVRALTLAGKGLVALEQRNRRRERLPQNAGKPWSLEEDQAAVDQFRNGLTVKQIAAKHKRTEGAIYSRLVRLGEIKEEE